MEHDAQGVFAIPIYHGMDELHEALDAVTNAIGVHPRRINARWDVSGIALNAMRLADDTLAARLLIRGVGPDVPEPYLGGLELDARITREEYSAVQDLGIPGFYWYPGDGSYGPIGLEDDLGRAVLRASARTPRAP